MPTNDEGIVKLEYNVEKLSNSVEKTYHLLTELLSRLAVVEAQLRSADLADAASILRIQKESDDIRRMIDDVRRILVELESKVSVLTVLNNNLNEQVKGMKSDYVTRDMFDPVRRIVYAVAGSLSMGVVAAILNLILQFKK